MPTVLLNLFNTKAAAQHTNAYERALKGALIVAKICEHLETKNQQGADSPLCFNKLAGVASAKPDQLINEFDVANMTVDAEQNVEFAPSQDAEKKLKP